MTTNGVQFDGRHIVHPGAYDQIDAEGMTISTQGNVNIPIVLGTSHSGEPGKVLWFKDPEVAKETLVGGDLLTAVDLMFSPTPRGGGGASTIGVMIVNALTKASNTIGGVKFTAKRFGESGNRIQVAISPGTVTGAKKVIVQKWDTNEIEVYPNLGEMFTLQYTGSETYAEVVITELDGKATKIETKTGDTSVAATVDVSIDLTTGMFPTVSSVVKHFNSISGYKAVVKDYRVADANPAKLSAQASLEIKTEVPILGVAEAVNHVLSRYSELVDVEATGAVTDADLQYLTGGATGETPASWANHLAKLRNHYSNMLIILSDDATIHAEALAHINQMERRNQKQLLFVGGGVKETVEQAKERANTLNSTRAVLAYPSIYHPSVGAGKVEIPAYFTAAMIAGRVAGVDATEPVTFDYFNLIGLGNDLLAGDPEIDELIRNGVAVLERTGNGGIRLVQGITTYISSSNDLYREISIRRGADRLSETVRKDLEDTFVGKKSITTGEGGVASIVSAIKTRAEDTLKTEVEKGNIVAYKDVVVKKEGTAYLVDYQVAPVEPVNFILVRSRFVRDASI